MITKKKQTKRNFGFGYLIAFLLLIGSFAILLQFADFSLGESAGGYHPPPPTPTKASMTERQINIIYGADFAPQWSSDGRMIAVGIRRGIKGVTADGTKIWDIPIEKPNHHITGLAMSPSLSSTGRVTYLVCYEREGALAFLGLDGEECAIETAAADGSAFENLSSIGAEIDNPVWSPDGSRLAFTTEIEVPHVNIYSRESTPVYVDVDVLVDTVTTAASDGSSIIRHPVVENWSAKRPVWSNDGQRLAYIASSSIDEVDDKGNRDINRARIATARWDGTDEKIVMEHRVPSRSSHLPPSFEPTSLAWSPADDRIYFVHYELLGGEDVGFVPRYAPSVRSVRTDGSDERIIALWWEHFRVKGLKVSPDGSQLLFTSYHALTEDDDARWSITAETDEELYVLKTDGSDVRKVFDPTVKNISSRTIYASWSPDGSRIAVHYLGSGGNVFTISPDGSDARMLIKPNIDGLPVPGLGEPLPEELLDPGR